MNEFLAYISSAEFIISIVVAVVALLIWVLVKKLMVKYAKT